MPNLERAEDYKIAKFFKGKDLISLLNCLFGLYSIYFVIQGNFTWAAIFLIFAFVADILDGKVARWLSQSNVFGKRMDIADLVSFGVAPAIFFIEYYSQNMGSYLTILLHIGAILLVSAAIFRLARFQTHESDVSGFIGLPTTSTGILYPILYFLGVPGIAVIIITFLVSYLMLSSIVIPVKE